MIVRDLGEAGRWFVETRAYPTARMAKRAWERAEAKLDLSAGDEGIGIIRLAPNPNPTTLSTGIPRGAHCIVVVTVDEPTLRKAQRLLSDGQVAQPTPEFADAMISRRLRVLLDHAGETGRLTIRRPEDRGAQFDRRGHLYEPPPGGEQ